MTKIEELEKQISALSANDLVELRKWFADFDAEQWDHQLETDVKNGKLDALAQKALDDHRQGKSREL